MYQNLGDACCQFRKAAPRLRSERGRLRGFGLRAELFYTEIGSDLAPHRSRISGPSFQLPGAGLARAWCGPGACLAWAWRGPGAALAILCWAQDCSFNPAAGAGLLHPFLRSQQDCPVALPAARLELFLPDDGAGPAVELPGFRHVVYAQDEGQAACEERVLELRVEGQLLVP